MDHAAARARAARGVEAVRYGEPTYFRRHNVDRRNAKVARKGYRPLPRTNRAKYLTALRIHVLGACRVRYGEPWRLEAREYRARYV